MIDSSRIERAEARAPDSPDRARGSRGTRPASRLLIRTLLVAAVLPVFRPAPTVATAPVFDLRGVPARIASLTVAERPGGLLPIAVLAVPGSIGAEGRWNVTVHVEVEGLALVENNQDPRPRIDVLLYGVDSTGAIVGNRAQAFRLELSAAATTLLSTGIRYEAELSLPPGHHRLRVLVRNATNDVWGLAEVAVNLPEAGEPIASPPLLEPSGADWWSVGGGQRSPPPARPVLVAGRQLEAALLADPVRPAAAELRFLRSGTEAFRTPVDLEEVSPGRLRIRTAVPEDAPPGTYDLHLDLRGPRGEIFPEPPRLEAIIVPPETRRSDLAWPGLRGRGVDSSPGGGGGIATGISRRDEGRREREESRALAEGYRRALAGLEVSPLRAVTALIAFETTAIEGRDVVARIEKLRSAELRVAENLADRDPAAMIPLVAVHQQLYLAYRDRQLPSLVAHSRLHSELLAERLAERSPDSEGTDTAALALTALGGILQIANLPQSSRRLFFRALQHDPDLRSARLGLAMSYERFGQLAAAVEELEQLIADHPEDVEAHLRRGLALLRLGRTSAARPALEDLAASAGLRWVQSLAFQALARIDLAEGRLHEAHLVLDRAVETIGLDGSIVALRVHLLDRRGQPRLAAEELGAMRPTAEPSSRWEYDAWPVDAYEEARNELERRARRHAPRLLELLGDPE